jgi:hypothetical protein
MFSAAGPTPALCGTMRQRLSAGCPPRNTDASLRDIPHKCEAFTPIQPLPDTADLCRYFATRSSPALLTCQTWT